MSQEPLRRSVSWAISVLAGLVLVTASLRHGQLKGEAEPAKPVAGTQKARPSPVDPEARPASPASVAPVPLLTRAAGRLPAPEPEGSYLEHGFEAPLRRSLDHYETWSLVSRELGWLMTHQEKVFVQDIQGQPASGGGYRLTYLSPGSFASARGLQVGDTLLDVNGFPIHSASDLAKVTHEPANLGSAGLRLILERDGQELTIDYRGARNH